MATAICFLRGLSIYLSFTSFCLREEEEAKVLGVTGDENITDAKKNKQTNKQTNKFMRVIIIYQSISLIMQYFNNQFVVINGTQGMAQCV